MADTDRGEYDYEAAEREAEERWRTKAMAIAPRLSADQYESLCKRRFGDANPTRFDNELWVWLVRTWLTPYGARGLLDMDGHDGGMGGQDPDWCFARFGRAEVTLTDGRTVSIGGEHEDSYDPDFCIYNDVVVRDRRDGRDEVTIYGYPPDVFPPTDSASATLVGDFIVVVGSIGYARQRGGPTPVFVLDTKTFQMRRLSTSGNDPGWIFKHRAELCDGGRAIEIRGGERIDGLDHPGAPEHEYAMWPNLDTYRLDLGSGDLAGNNAQGVWTRITDMSGGRQFLVRYDEDPFIGTDVPGDALALYDGTAFSNLGYPFSPYEELPEEDEEHEDPNWSSPDRVHVLTVDGVRVELWDEYRVFRVLIRGDLPKATANKLMVDIAQAIHASGRPDELVAERRV